MGLREFFVERDKFEQDDKNAMITNNIAIQIVKGVEDAARYNKPWKALRITKCVIVPKGTVGGNPTVDILMVDENSNQYVALVTGSILENLTGAIAGVRQRIGC